ncbi:hypothetical protein N7510_007750 [Penicillium lagena]|uniref:uncharacterized protein n=1 Tax=Penicillium lagena TaxID=94218 RepID=UPI0025406AF4|nr:uncharacterized protein N7510_007750 [Penicillium lagena]KAJ5611031.1 hypothetical protein N7510_007750 [Penicillium lagena]
MQSDSPGTRELFPCGCWPEVGGCAQDTGVGETGIKGARPKGGKVEGDMVSTWLDSSVSQLGRRQYGHCV